MQLIMNVYMVCNHVNQQDVNGNWLITVKVKCNVWELSPVAYTARQRTLQYGMLATDRDAITADKL